MHVHVAGSNLGNAEPSISSPNSSVVEAEQFVLCFRLRRTKWTEFRRPKGYFDGASREMTGLKTNTNKMFMGLCACVERIEWFRMSGPESVGEMG